MVSISFDELKVKAEVFVSHLLMGDFTSASGQFDSVMDTALGSEKLAEAWQTIIAEQGTLLEMNVVGTNEIESHRIVIVRCQFQMAIIDVQIAFNSSGQVSGLNFTPTGTKYHPPEYVNESNFHEVDVKVGGGEWELPGILTLPNTDSKVPCVILVHGSGPNDMDETIGPNKTFKDLAWGLASIGIAALRYNKRTLEHSKKLTPDLAKQLTVKEETVDDAILAVELARQRDEIDSNRVFLVGHSLGATLAPLIGQQCSELAGLVMMAAITRSLEQTILDQFTYIYNLSGNITKEQKADLVSLKEKVDKLKDPKIAENISPEDLPLGIPVAYWLDYHQYNPVRTAKTLKMPVLVLQGGRDYQVLEKVDFRKWKVALKHKENATLKLFPSLNHLFIYGEGKSEPKEYLTEGHVAEEVITTISSWIKSLGVDVRLEPT